MDLLGSNEIEVALNNNQSGFLGEIGLNFSEIASIIYQDDFEHTHYQDGILTNYTKALDLEIDKCVDTVVSLKPSRLCPARARILDSTLFCWSLSLL